MRWLIVQPGPSWSVHDVFVGWAEALRDLGEHVDVFNLDERLAFYEHAAIDTGEKDPAGQPIYRKAVDGDQAKNLAVNGLAAALWKIRPDVLFVISGFFIPAELLDHARRHGTRVVVMHTEEPYEVERELALAAHADLNLLNDPLYIERFAAVAPTVYAPHAYRPSVHHPGAALPALAADLAFVGTGFGSRRWFFGQMHAAGYLDGLDVLLGGNWRGLEDDSPLRKYIGADDVEKCLDNADAADVYRSARASVNLYRREADGDDPQDIAGIAMGPREVEMAACGLFFLRDPRPEGDVVLGMLPTFGSPEEAGELLKWWLAHDDAREGVAARAMAAVQGRTFHASARSMLRLFDRQPAKP